MADPEYPVMVSVDRGGGRMENVRVGTATRRGDAFVLRLGELQVQLQPSDSGSVSPYGAPGSPARATGPGDGDAVFPNYGRSKGQPVQGASVGDLEFYANGCRRTLADQAKSRWHDKERALLAAIEAELQRQQAGSPSPARYADSPPSYLSREDDRPPPDDDIPF